MHVPPIQQTEEIQQPDREVALPREDHSEAVALPREDHSEQAAEPAESIVESGPPSQIEEKVVIPENVMPTPPRVQRTRKAPAYLKDYVTNFKGPKGKQ